MDEKKKVALMAQLEIRLLGSFQVSLNGLSVTGFETDSARALLAYTAMQAGTPLARETLAGLMWPEQSRSKALHALSQTLNRLRKALNERDATTPFLCVTPDSLQFNADSDYWLDVTVFARLLAECQQHPHRGMGVCRTCLARLAQAAALYHGDLLSAFFMNSKPFEEWLVLQREHLHRQAMEILGILAAYEERLGEYEQARQYAWRQVELEPWCEEAHQQLMRALALNGQRSAALAQYKACHRVLTEEMGLPPSPETTALREQIQAEQLAPDPTYQHNLPAQLTPFVGRESELAQITEQINHPDCRLLTLMGPGGIGKTRLALRAASAELGAFRDGVRWVSLDAVCAFNLPTALAQSLEVTFEGLRSPWQQLGDYLREKEMLLVLDSLEHLVPEIEPVAELLQRAPRLRVLATSRERLDVQGEWLLAVGGLPYPGQDAIPGNGRAFEDWEAVRLFVQSAARLHPGFALSPLEQPEVARICQLVEGMPLGIELAAVWLRALSCREVAQEIQRDLNFLTTFRQAAPERQRNLRAVFDHSWVLLSPEERNCFDRLAVFQGSFEREAAQQVTGATVSILAALVDQSLLRQVSEPAQPAQARYELHTLLRRYAAEKLASAPDVERETQDRHGAYYLALLRKYESDLKGRALRRALESIGAEIRNVRVAWTWAVERGQIAGISQALESLFLFYDLQGWFQEGKQAFEHVTQALEEALVGKEKSVLGQALACQGWFVFQLGRPEEALILYERGLALSREMNARPQIVFALNRLGLAAFNSGAYEQAKEKCQASLAICRAIGDSYHMAATLNTLGWIAQAQSNYAEARQYGQQGLALARAAGLGRIEADGLRLMGVISFESSCYDEAGDHWKQSLNLCRELGLQRNESIVLHNLGALAFQQGDYSGAWAFLEQSLRMKQRSGERRVMAPTLSILGATATCQGDYTLAQGYYERALQINREIGVRRGEGLVLNNLGLTAMMLGSYDEAQLYLEQSLSIGREIGNRLGEGQTLGNLGLLFHQRGNHQAACDYCQQALSIAQELGNRRDQAYALVNLGQALAGLGRLPQAAEAYGQSLELRRELGERHLANESLAGLARVSLARGELPQAMAHVESILRYLDENSLAGLNEPFGVYLICYRVLQAAQNPRAESILSTAHTLLQERAAKINPAALRRSFLENVAAHQEIAAEWAKTSAAASR